MIEGAGKTTQKSGSPIYNFRTLSYRLNFTPISRDAGTRSRNCQIRRSISNPF